MVVAADQREIEIEIEIEELASELPDEHSPLAEQLRGRVVRQGQQQVVAGRPAVSAEHLLRPQLVAANTTTTTTTTTTS